MRLLSTKCLAAAAAVLTVCGAAVAIGSPYLALRGSLAFANDMNTTVAGVPLRTSLDTGWTAAAAVGEKSDWLGLRLELEGLYGKFNAGGVTNNGIAVTNVSGGIQAAAAMVNGIWDIPVAHYLPQMDSYTRYAQPFIGAGFGGVYVSSNVSGTGLTLADDHNWSLGYQLMAGIAVPISQTTRLTVMYRYIDAPWVRLQNTAGATYKTGFSSNNIGVGLEFYF